MRQLAEKTPAHARNAQASIESFGKRKAINQQAALRPQHAARPVANSGSARPAAQSTALQTIVRPVAKQSAKDKTFTERFERKEDKYLLSAEQFRRLLEAASRCMKSDEHGQTQVRSLYYDTPDYELIERSLDKPTYKEKLRVRSYGLPTETSPVFVEIKKKFKGVVYKRRVCMTSAAASRYLEGMPYRDAYLSAPLAEPYSTAQAFSPIATQTVKEIDVFLTRYGRLQPAMLITCDRRAYVDPEGSGLRITFDSNIIADPAASDLFGSDGMGNGSGVGTPIIHPSETLMEIKSEGSLPLWLVHLLSECKAYPQSFSKYGNAYLMLCRDKVYGGKTGARECEQNSCS